MMPSEIAESLFDMTKTMSDTITEEEEELEISAITQELVALEKDHTPLYMALEFIARDHADKWD